MNGLWSVIRIINEIKKQEEDFMNLKIKKTAVGILAAALILLVGTATALASGQEHGKNFVDDDSDGVCDNFSSGLGQGGGSRQNGNFVDVNNDGICDNFSSGLEQGGGSGQNGNFVDADNDGVCDNLASGQGQGGSGQGHGGGSGQGAQGRQGNGYRGGRNK